MLAKPDGGQLFDDAIGGLVNSPECVRRGFG